jgi:hypothetical protein
MPLSAALQDNYMIIQRALIFAREQLRSHWPDQWDPNVLHYFKGKDGTEYRFVKDRGTRFIRLTGGQPETIYWRAHGTTEIDAAGAGVHDWVGYDGSKIIGLNPHVPAYVVAAGLARPPVVISSVPEGYAINRSVVRDGYWLAGLDLIENLKTRPLPDAKQSTGERSVKTIRVRAGQPVQFLGVESAKQLSDGEYEVQVALPGAFSAYWGAATDVVPGPIPTPLVATAHDRLSGLAFERYPKTNLGASPCGEVPAHEVTTTWLLKLPADPLRFGFSYGTNHGYGDGAFYMVRVNGRELWKEYRPQESSNSEEQKARKAPPQGVATIDLSPYAGQTIILECANNGNQSGGSETLGWYDVRLEKAP